MSNSDVTYKVEPNIYFTNGKRFLVRIRVNHEQKEARFDTLSEARRFKKELIATRPKREKQRGRPDMSIERSVEKRTIREILKQAPRTTITRGDREYTLIRLPEWV